MQTVSFHCRGINKEVTISTPLGTKPKDWQIAIAQALSERAQRECQLLGLGCQCRLAQLSYMATHQIKEEFL